MGLSFPSTQLLAVFQIADHVIFDILLNYEGQPLQMSPPRHLCGLMICLILRQSDSHDSTTSRSWRSMGSLHSEALLDPGETTLLIPTSNATQNTPCYYRMHPEEASLFTLIKVATGLTNQHIIDSYIGGDYARWSNAYLLSVALH